MFFRKYLNRVIKLNNNNLNFNSFKWQLYSQGIGLIYLLVTTGLRAKILPLKDFANIAIAIAFVASFQSMFNLQTWRAVIKFGNDKLSNSNFSSLINIVRNGLLIDSLSIALSLLLIISTTEMIANMFLWESDVKDYIYILSISVLFNYSQGVILGYFRLYNMFVFISKRQISIYFLFLVVNISAFFFSPKPIFFIWVYVAQIVVNELINVYYFIKVLNSNKENQNVNSSFIIDRELIKFNFWVYVKSLADIPFRTFDILLASKFLTINETGIYSALKRLLGAFNQFIEPLNIIIYPKLSKHSSMGEIDEGFKFLGYMNKWLTLVCTFIALIICIYSKEILSLLFSDKFITGYQSLIIIVLFKLPFYGLQLYYSYFLVLGFAKQASLISFIGTVTYLILAYFLSIQYGLDGFVFAVSMNSVITTLLIFPFLKTKYNFKFFH